MSPAEIHPYSRLSPERVVAAVEALGLACDGRVLALNSYENRVYQVGIEDAEPVVVKFYRPGRWSLEALVEEHEFAGELASLDVPVVAPLSFANRTLHEFDGFRYAAYPRRGGRWPELGSRDERVLMGRFIGRLHRVGAARRFRHRARLDAERLGRESAAYLLDNDWIPSHLTDAYASLTDDLLERVDAELDDWHDAPGLRIHGDLHPGNVLWTDRGAHIVDLDDTVTGPAVQDLWMLLSGERDERNGQLGDLLLGYGEFSQFTLRELRWIEPLRTLRMIHYAAWLARRWNDPAFPLAFPWFAENRYWEQHVLDLREQFAALDEEPLTPEPTGRAERF